MATGGCDAAAVEAISVPPSVAAYCRQARRVRGRLAGQPARMHRALRRLSTNKTAEDAESVRPARSNVRDFASEVAGELDGTVLRYANRRRLIARARRLGIGDFEANLIIAAVQHERRRTGVDANPLSREGRRLRGWSLAPLLIVLAVESLVALGLWQVFLR